MKLVRNEIKFIPQNNEFSVAGDYRFKELFDDALVDKDVLLSDIVVSEQNNTFVVDLRVYYRTDAVLLYKQHYIDRINFTVSTVFLERLKIAKIRKEKTFRFF